MFHLKPLEIEGTIDDITTENNNGSEKKVITLKAGRSNTLFVEFQGNKVNLLDGFIKGDRVIIKPRYNGKVSKIGRKYNNIIGKTIKKLEYANSN